MRFAVLVVVAACVAACSDSTACAPTAPCAALRSTADSLAGSWKEVQTWNGMSVQLSLSSRDTTLVGSGTYSVAGGTGGTANVTGVVFWQDSVFVPAGYVIPPHPVFVLDLTFSNGTSAVFDQGVIEQQNTLSGALTFSNDQSASYVTSFVRATP